MNCRLVINHRIGGRTRDTSFNRSARRQANVTLAFPLPFDLPGPKFCQGSLCSPSAAVFTHFSRCVYCQCPCQSASAQKSCSLALCRRSLLLSDDEYRADKESFHRALDHNGRLHCGRVCRLKVCKESTGGCWLAGNVDGASWQLAE